MTNCMRDISDVIGLYSDYIFVYMWFWYVTPVTDGKYRIYSSEGMGGETNEFSRR